MAVAKINQNLMHCYNKKAYSLSVHMRKELKIIKYTSQHTKRPSDFLDYKQTTRKTENFTEVYGFSLITFTKLFTLYGIST